MGATYGTVLNPGTKVCEYAELGLTFTNPSIQRNGSRAPPDSELKNSTLTVQEKKKEVILKKDTKPKEPEAGADGKEKKLTTKTCVPYLNIIGLTLSY